MTKPRPIQKFTWHVSQSTDWKKLFLLWQTHLKLSQSDIDSILHSGGIHLDGKRIDPLPVLPPCPSRIDLYFTHTPLTTPQITKTNLLYEDENLIAVDKPPGLATQATRLSTKNCLQYQLQNLTGISNLMAVHRLDTPTSGLIIFGKGKDKTAALMKLFSERNIIKTYHALVSTKPDENEFVISGYLKRDARFLPANVFVLEEKDDNGFFEGIQKDPAESTAIKEMTNESYSKNESSEKSANPDMKNSRKWSETFFKVLDSTETHTLLEAKPITGRTHQIRAHLASKGCPIIGDDLYGSTIEASRLGLQSVSLEIPQCHLYPNGLLIRAKTDLLR